MKKTTKPKELLEVIAERLHCDYISDLQLKKFHKYLQFYLPLPDEFSEYEWNDAVEYIIGIKTDKLSSKESYLLLKNFSKDPSGLNKGMVIRCRSS
ncbi:hypothetical protein [Vallitalea guaymasensis]|uniref:Uncharacterized protein n=1 Tax=Vallitalea guaymasensis TaxID=1185412 RepID=A0A8J8MEB7_9FIRM|nr:hypothetical protein [Vallitalea guaymasensis]QUH31382.1 hypothetical protein HYG85_21625 [Vallitalea guaymasensis]